MPIHWPKALVSPALAILAGPLLAGTVEIVNPTTGTYTLQRNASLLPDCPATFRTAWDDLRLLPNSGSGATTLVVTTPGTLKFVLKDDKGDFCLIKVRTKETSATTTASTLETLDHRAEVDGALRLEQGNRIVITKAFFGEKTETKTPPVDGPGQAGSALGATCLAGPIDESKEAPGACSTASTPEGQSATAQFRTGLQESLKRCRTVLDQISRLETSVTKNLALPPEPSNRAERSVARHSRVDLANAFRDLGSAGAQCQLALDLAGKIPPGDRTPEVEAQCVTLEQLELMLHAQESSLLTLSRTLQALGK